MDEQIIVAKNDLSVFVYSGDESEVQQLSCQIDINDPMLSISWGVKPMTGIAQFSEALLQNVRAKDAGAVGEQLTDLLMKVKSVDLSKFGDKKSFLESIPLLGKFFSKAERFILEYKTLAEQVAIISKNLNKHSLLCYVMWLRWNNYLIEIMNISSKLGYISQPERENWKISGLMNSPQHNRRRVPVVTRWMRNMFPTSMNILIDLSVGYMTCCSHELLPFRPHLRFVLFNVTISHWQKKSKAVFYQRFLSGRAKSFWRLL
ncbi:TelA-like protein SA1238 [Escherichia albertii]|nr:TelA-like protein SA1238 [Escherichia coli]